MKRLTFLGHSIGNGTALRQTDVAYCSDVHLYCNLACKNEVLLYNLRSQSCFALWKPEIVECMTDEGRANETMDALFLSYLSKPNCKSPSVRMLSLSNQGSWGDV